MLLVSCVRVLTQKETSKQTKYTHTLTYSQMVDCTFSDPAWWPAVWNTHAALISSTCSSTLHTHPLSACGPGWGQIRETNTLRHSHFSKIGGNISSNPYWETIYVMRQIWCSPCCPVLGGSSSHRHGNHAQSYDTPPHSRHKALLEHFSNWD